jgi:hypothetical protein
MLPMNLASPSLLQPFLFTNTMTAYPALDTKDYSWKPLIGDASIWQRRTLGPESTWHIKNCDIFVSAALSFRSTVSASEFTGVIERAWLNLRFEVPEIATQIVIGDNDVSYVQYCIPKHKSELQDWNNRTAFVETGTTRMSFRELRDKLVARKSKNGTDPVHLLVLLDAGNKSNTLLLGCQVVLCVNHQITDGIGTRILFGRFLSSLAHTLSKSTIDVWNEEVWKHSGSKLSVPWIEVMNDDQVISGPVYERIVAENEENLRKQVTKLISNYLLSQS